jgi:hypothetical protein
MIGNSIGNDNTGNNAFFDDALDIIADITVVAEAIAKELIVTININNPSEIIGAEFANRKNRIIEKKLINKLNIILKINFPKNIELELTTIWSNSDVPRSSSATNDFESPIIVPKNITIHSKLAVASSDNCSAAKLIAMIVIVVKIKSKIVLIE